jgi:hypothetical protein
MPVRDSVNEVTPSRSSACVLALGCTLLLPVTTLAEEYPSLRPGLWEFIRTTNDGSGAHRQTKFTRQRCTDPVADMKRLKEKLVQQGCMLTPQSRQGDVYEVAAVCTVMGGQMESRTFLTVEGDGAYSAIVVSSGDYGSVTEEVSAVRLGDCRK